MTSAFDLNELNQLLCSPLEDMCRQLGLVTTSTIGRIEDRLTTGLTVRLSDHLLCKGPGATIEFYDGFWEDLTPQGWEDRFRQIHRMLENAARRMRGELLIDLLGKDWSLNYVDDDTLQKLENVALKTMTFVDQRRKKFVV